MLKFNYTKTYKSIVIRVFTWLFRKPELKRLRANFDMFEDILEHAINQHKEGHKDKFIEAYLLMGNKLLVDVLSTKTVSFLGLHGSAHALLAVILRTVRMIGALHLEPRLIDEYLDEEKTSDTNEGFRKKFSESSLQKILDNRFGKNERGKYANLDKALHGSSVGAKIYYARIRHNANGTKGGDIIYDAFFEDEKSAAVINILNGALLDTCGVYLERYQNNNSLVELRKKYDFYIEIEAKEILKESLKQAMKEKFRETSNDN
jgi:hypothetical protein